MTSKSLSQGTSPSRNSPQDDNARSFNRSLRYRQVNVFDATAGKISAAGFIPSQPVISSTRDTASSSNTAIPPENVLFRLRHAPTRYAESDIYFTNERNDVAALPESDLLKALHSYASDFYSRSTVDGGVGDWKSLDETALIALGILMEEASLDILGNSGDLVFTEGEAMESSPLRVSAPKSVSEGRPRKKQRFNDELMDIA